MKQLPPSPPPLDYGVAKHQANRRVAVFVSLFATVTLTSLLLLALAKPPLTSSAWRSLFAVDRAESLETIFQTQTPPAAGRWRYIYIHHSRTVGGDAVAFAQGTGGEAGLTGGPFTDHFVVGNGDGCGDGEVQMTQSWNRQQSINAIPGGGHLSSACISICVVGDFARTPPTANQRLRLVQLVQALQSRLRIPAGAVFVHPENDTAAGAGHAFGTASAFRDQLLP